MQPAIIELLLFNKRTDINKHSPLHGSPLHTACRAGSLKIVQQLLLNKASIYARCEVIKFVNGQRIVSNLTPQEVTKDTRIIALIVRYQERLKSGSKMEEEIQYGPTDSFVNAPYQNMSTKAGQIISMKDMVNEE